MWNSQKKIKYKINNFKFNLNVEKAHLEVKKYISKSSLKLRLLLMPFLSDYDLEQVL